MNIKIDVVTDIAKADPAKSKAKVLHDFKKRIDRFREDQTDTKLSESLYNIIMNDEQVKEKGIKFLLDNYLK